jgi:hypothetical protein
METPSRFFVCMLVRFCTLTDINRPLQIQWHTSIAFQMGLYVPGDALSGFLVSLLGFLAGQDARNSTLALLTRHPMYKSEGTTPH